VKKLLQVILLAFALLVITVLAGYFKWYRTQPTPADYINAAQIAGVPGGKPNTLFLWEHCGRVEWRHSSSEDGKQLVEASGNLKVNGQPVLVRWEVTILRDTSGEARIANPVYASIAGRKIEPPKDFANRITDVAKGK
jgi:hypothetical protein